MKLKIPCQIFLRRISQNEIRNSAVAEMKTPSPKPARIPPQTQYERIYWVGGEFRHARANTKSGQPRRPAR